MPKRMTRFVLMEQPINWSRALLVGAMSATFMAAFIDTFYMLAITPFSYEYYLGGLLFNANYGTHTWTLGFFANAIVGALFGIFYGYCFEYVFQKASGRLGITVGLWHLLIAAIAFFPFCNAMAEFMGAQVYPKFGLLGFSLGLPTLILIITGHFLFGASMGVFYGPVRVERVRARYSEPGELGQPGEPGIPTVADDPPDRALA